MNLSTLIYDHTEADARRMPVVEEQIKVANHRISELERKVDHA